MKYFDAAAIVLIALASPAQAAETVLRFAHHLSPEHSLQAAALTFAREVADASRGRIAVHVLPSGQLGSERQLLEEVLMGAVDIAPISSNIISSKVPIADLTSLPYLIKTLAQAFAIEDSNVGQEMNRQVEANTGAHVIANYPLGIRVLASTDHALSSVADFRGLRIRVPESRLMTMTFKALGANPTPVPWGDLYTGLATHVVDAAESPPEAFATARLFEVARFVTLTNHMYSSMYLLISNRCWSRLATADRDIITRAGHDSQGLLRTAVVAGQREILEKIKAQGVKVSTIDRKEMKSKMEPLYAEFRSHPGARLLLQQALAVK